MIGELSAEKRLLLELLRRRKAGDPEPRSKPPADSPRDRGPFSLLSAADRAILPPGLEDAYPLASMQLGMLYHTELTRDDEVPAYHNVFLFDVDSAIDPGLFTDAVQLVVARHPILRTSFDLRRFSEPLQLVHRRAYLPVPCIDLAGLDDAARERELDRFLRWERRRVLDPSQAPLLRFFLHRLGDSRFRVTMTESHTIAEGWGTYQTLGEIQDLYFALLRGERPRHDRPLELTYREFIRLEREALASAECRRYWEEALADGHPVQAPRWPWWRGGSATEERTHIFRMPDPVLQGLLDLSRRLQVPFKSVLLAVHLKVLGVLTGRSDLAVALHVHGRPEETGGEYVRGVFNNTVPLRVKLATGSWIDLIRGVFATELALLPFQRYPAAAIQRDTGMMSQLEIQIGYVNFHLFGEFQTSDQVTSPGGLDRSLSHYPLTLFFWASGPGPAVLDLRCERFDPAISKAQILLMRGYYEEILQAMLGEPGSDHDARSWLRPAEQHQMLLEYNDTALAFAQEPCLHRLFERQAALTPGAVAVSSEEASLSYGELDARAGHLARRLRRLGVGPDVVVGICADRSLGLMVGLLGILKAGGAYLPLDPSYPPERLTFMLEDGLKGGRRPVLLAQKRWSPLFADWISRAHARLVDLDEVWAAAGDDSEAGAEAGDGGEWTSADPSNLAYVIYTSGSTGRPKGVMIPHRAISNRLLWMQSEHPLTPTDAVVQKTPFSFDASVWEIFVPLFAGARVVLARPGGHQDSGYLVRLIQEQGATSLQLVPSMLQVFAEEPGLEDCRTLRRLWSGGEALPEALARRLDSRLGIPLVNLYGPTESSIDASSWPCDLASPGPVVPIGRPIANVEVHLLDPRQQPVPIGVPGELYIGGAGLARGYHGRPELTAERFVPDAFGPRAGDRLFRTGDLAFHRPDGVLEFLGRIDQQVKLRGFRIELGEIEEVLLQHPAVREAVVVAREERPGDMRLVAYAASQEPGPEISDLRSWLAERLPEFMVPAAYVLLTALPRTPSGKVDRKALPAPEWQRTEKIYLAPRTPVEEVLAGIWSEVLGLERVGAADNFFDLGGHSLLAMRVISRLRNAFGVEVPLRDLFEAPTLAELAARIARGSQAPAPPPLVRTSETGDLPLAFAQQRLLFLYMLTPDDVSYNMPIALRLRGRVEPARLDAALKQLVARHEVLRTTFSLSEKQPAQRIAPAGAHELSLLDLSGLPGTLAEQEVFRFVKESVRPFDLFRGPVLRTALLRLRPDEHIFVADVHHIAMDGWSWGIFCREMVLLYRQGDAAQLPTLPARYADFAVWQRRWLQGEPLDRQLEYWRKRLAGIAPAEIPADHPRPPVRSGTGASLPIRMEGGLIKALRSLGRQEDATLFMSLMAAFSILVHHRSARDQVVIGTDIANRPLAELEGLIGLFVNQLVLSFDLSGTPTFREVLQQVRLHTLEAYAHQDAPFDKLVESLKPERDMGRTPLFQIKLVLQNVPLEAQDLQDLSVTTLDVPWQTAKFDLLLNLTETGDGITGLAEYSTDLFERSTIVRLVQHFEALLAAVVAEPSLRLPDLDLLSAAERHQLLTEWERPRLAAPTSSIHGMFARIAAGRPEAPAVSFEGQVWSYGELDRQSNRLARTLRRLGVGPEVLVGIVVERSFDMVVGALGVLKAGGAYVPLDPAYPRERLAWLQRDAGVAVLLTETRLRDAADGEASQEIQVLCLDDADLLAGASAEPLEIPVVPENLAYVIYTSGSTGRPKGVQVTHGNVLELLTATEPCFGFGPDDVWTLFHSFSFDFSVWEIWGALLYGGRLVIVPYWVSRSPEDFHQLLRAERVTVLNQTPSAFRQLIEADRDAPADLALRWVIFGGEALDFNGLRPWFEKHGDARPRMINMYGITETTVHVTFRRVLFEDLPPQGSPVRGSGIGRPLAHLAAYGLDASLQPLPIGVPGELVIGGGGVARGYLGRPDLTAERFVPDPWSGISGGRLYRSGDLGMHLGTGELAHLGRIDHQVKIRGFRIELGEIEAVLVTHPKVREALVLVRESDHGNQILACVLPHSQAERPLASELRSHSEERLPDYMVPAIFAVLDGFPLTPNGKVDRQALLDAGSPGHEEIPYAPPRTFVEEVLAEVWAQVLGVSRVGIDDHFFSLGGDSIRSLQILSLARKRGLALTLQELFQRPTIRRLAESVTIEELAPDSGPTPFSLISAEDRKRLDPSVEDAYPLAKLQAGMLFHSELDPASAVYHDLTSFHIRAPFDPDRMREALRQVSLLHPVLRTSFDLAGFSEPLQLVHTGVSVPLEIHDLRQVAPEEQDAFVSEWLSQERRRRFDWTRPPLVVFHAHLRGEASLQLTMSFHHAILDGWSVASLLTDLFRRYALLLRGEAPPPDLPLEVAYRDFVALERAALSSEETRSFWSRMLDGAEPTRLPRLSPPASRPGPVVREIHAPLSPALSDATQRLARQAEVPLKSLMLALHLKVVGLLGGTRDVLTGLVSHGRPEHPDSERALGLFLNTLPLRARLGGGSWRDLARGIFDLESGMLPHRRFPFAEMGALSGGRLELGIVYNFLHFHVYQDTAGVNGIEVLERYGYEETNFSLVVNLSLDPFSQRLQLVLVYRPADLDTEAAERVSDYLLRAMAAAVADPEAPHDSSLLSATERQQLLRDFNDTAAFLPEDSLPEGSTLPGLVAAHAARTPSAVAVKLGDEVWTYGLLVDSARRLAWHLRELGVGPDTIVGLCAERSPSLVVGMLGVLMAGGAYLPLDPTYPAQRLEFMLEDSGARILLVQEHLAERVPVAGSRVARVLLDARWSSGDEPAEAPEVEVTPANLAYVIYTSGSTGWPKGVQVPRSGLMSLVRWHLRAYGLSLQDRATLIASPAFDASVWETWPCLAAGASLHIPDEETRLHPGRLLAWMAEEGITISFLPTPLAEQVVETEMPPGLRLRALLTGGDRLQRAPRRPLPFALINHYGPTESSVVATCAEVEPLSLGLPSIGGPIHGTRAYVVDALLDPVPVGTPGELLLGGSSLARGYLGRPDLTAERFLPDPFGDGAGGRLYRTGDLVRWLPESSLDFLGRRDHQVKVRGFRIELGEIEAALSALPEVGQAAVLVREDTPGDPRLVAYVVGDIGDIGDVGAGRLREALRERLPDSMVPSAFVSLAALPLTPNGKVDRNALPAPELPSREEGYVAPRTPVEEILADIWSELLGVERVGAADDFFNLGGHSLLAVLLMAKIEKRLGKTLPLAALFSAPTLESLARLLAQTGSHTLGRRRSPLVAIKPQGTRVPFFCVHPVSGNVLCYLELANRLAPEQPFFALQTPDLAEGSGAPSSIEDMAALYLEEVRRIQPQGPYLLGGWSMGGLIAFEMARILEREGDRPDLVAIIDTLPPAQAADLLEPLSEEELMVLFVTDLARALGHQVRISPEDLRSLTTQERLSHIVKLGRAAGLVPEDIGLPRIASLFETFSINFRASQSYDPGPYPGHLVLWHSEQTLSTVSPDRLAAWNRLAQGVETSVLAGDHYTLLLRPQVERLADELTERIGSYNPNDGGRR